MPSRPTRPRLPKGGAFRWARVREVAAADSLRGVESLGNLGVIGIAVAGAATLASLPRLAKAGRLAWRNGSLEGGLSQVTLTVLQALVDTGVLGEHELAGAAVEVHASLDGRKEVVLTGVSRHAERQVMQGGAEVLGPVQNPRYLLVRRSWLGPRRHTDYHAVPAVLAARKEGAECFAALWQERVGHAELVFARMPEGRRLLLRARAASFAAGFQRRVDRRSVWL